MRITVLNENTGGFDVQPLHDCAEKFMLLLFKFNIRGNLRFLSHAEVLKVFQRACIRAGIKMQYSQGFNPRPRLSLPLPRSVGVETDDDLLCVRIDQSTGAQAHNGIGALCTSIKAKLSEQLPGDFELLSVEVTKAKSAPQPRTATYVLAVRQEYVNEELKARIERVLASESLNIQRRIAGKLTKCEIRNEKFKNVDVRGFLGSIELVERDILIECKISSTGSIRVEEVLKLLELDAEKLAAPIRRSNVQFVTCDS